MLGILVSFSMQLNAQRLPAKMQYGVSMERAAEQLYHVELTSLVNAETLDFKMCAWTPGYYQLMEFWRGIQDFEVTDQNGTALKWEKAGNDIWRVKSNNSSLLKISYNVKAKTDFVGSIYLDEKRGYITPGGLFLYLDQQLQQPLTIKMKPYSKWTDLVATGLDTIPNQYHVYKADNFDVLYDSPFLMGNLEVLPAFKVKGKPHNFIGYQLPPFNRQKFMNNIEKIVKTGSQIIGDVPYTHYSFLYIGAGGGGIEHLNSASLSFGKERLKDSDDFSQLYTFIAHEYFHTFNVKRIRPIELGPFDYSKETHTNMLWVAEGFTSYYENIIGKRAGLLTDQQLINNFQSYIKNHEKRPGHLYQSATQASWNTWNDGPNGLKNGEIDKTISYYDKGAILGLLFDFNIRHVTENKKSLDDVMRKLYAKYYKQLKRGFTEQEFREECEKVAGGPLTELFDYASTVKPLDYSKYLAYGGLAIDKDLKITVMEKTDTLQKAIYNSWLGR